MSIFFKDTARNFSKIRMGGNKTMFYSTVTFFFFSESSEVRKQLKSLLMKVKEESEKSGLKLNMQTRKIMASGPITSWQIDGEILETVADFYFFQFFQFSNIFPDYFQNHCRS